MCEESRACDNGLSCGSHGLGTYWPRSTIIIMGGGAYITLPFDGARSVHLEILCLSILPWNSVRLMLGLQFVTQS